MNNMVKEKDRKGSKYWIQEMVNNNSKLLNNLINLGDIEWISPILEDDYKEYRLNGNNLINKLRLEGIVINKIFKKFSNEKNGFWPLQGGGPQWDAIGVINNSLILVEAKAHVGEAICRNINKNPSERSQENTQIIEESFDEVKIKYGFNKDKSNGWIDRYYQIANRITFWYFLNRLNIETELIFLYFTNDCNYISSTKEEYEKNYKKIYDDMFDNKPLPSDIKIIYIDCRMLK